MSKLCKAEGTIIINEITKGNKIVQQNDINWSKRIYSNLTSKPSIITSKNLTR